MSVRIEEQNVCAFCQKRSGEVRRMIGSKTGVFICDECVRACNDILRGEVGEKPVFKEDELPTPREIKEKLDESIVGQEEAKKRQSFSAPHGTPEYVNRISLRGSLCVNDFATLSAQPSYVLIFNHNNKSGCTEQGFEFALSCSVKIPGILK